MNHDDVEIKILEEEVSPSVPESLPAPKVQERAADVAHKVWQSETRKKVTQGVGRGAKKIVQKGGQAAANVIVQTAERQARERTAAVQQRLQETDWKQVAKEGTSTGLRWLSRKFAALAAKFTPSEEDGNQ